MKFIRITGLTLFFIAMATLFVSLSMGEYILTNEVVRESIANEKHRQDLQPLLNGMMNKTYSSRIAFIQDFQTGFNDINRSFRDKQMWDNVIWDDYTFALVKNSAVGIVVNNLFLHFFICFIIAIIGGLLAIIPAAFEGPPGIKNNHVFFQPVSNRGLIGILLGIILISFYVVLYKFPEYITNWVLLFDPLSLAISGQPADQWFLYGMLYCIAMGVMGVRMIIKYRNNAYQVVRTISVIFFQFCFAFTLPQIMKRLHLPSYDLKSAWPLEYTFFFDYRLDEHLATGNLGVWLLVWGILLFTIGVPTFTYFFGKRWYCSWVCGCGGLAETLGDPFRQLSDKSLKSWKTERFLIHGVLVYAVVMTGAVLYSYFSGTYSILGISTYTIRDQYGFFIGFAFAGVVGTGFYPLMGNRMWCRFGCPLAAYLGLIQRFKSRFRITTNGGQCISCGNCSTYCEMGIDVRWYAQRGQNIVRSSCVGCGICSSVCPRGVLKLEQGPETGRINTDPILIGSNAVTLNV